jgi:hypothetical protein
MLLLHDGSSSSSRIVPDKNESSLPLLQTNLQDMQLDDRGVIVNESDIPNSLVRVSILPSSNYINHALPEEHIRARRLLAQKKQPTVEALIDLRLQASHVKIMKLLVQHLEEEAMTERLMSDYKTCTGILQCE